MERANTSVLSSKKYFVILMVILSLIIIAAGFVFYKIEESSIRQQRYNELKAVADLKVTQIEQWIKERKGDVQAIAESPFFEKGVTGWIKDTGNAQLKNEILEQLNPDQKVLGYENIFIASPEGRLLLSTGEEIKAFDSYTEKGIKETSNKGEIVFTDFYFSQAEKMIHYDIIVPIINVEKQTVAVLVFRRNPKDYLYPLIQTWPTPSKSAETALFRVEDDSVVYLNDLRQLKNTALKLKIPLTRTEVPAVKGALGNTGLIEGVDYRGVKVLADIRKVPGTNWIMLSKIDTSEIYSDLYLTAEVISGFAFILILISGVGFAFIYNSRQKNIFMELYGKEKELWHSQEKFKVTIDSLGDGVITADTLGKVQYLNKMAEELTGWKLREAKGRQLHEVYSVKNEETGKRENNIIEKVLKHGIVKELANHTLLISRQGEEIPVMDTGAPIFDTDGSITGLVLTFQDETEKRRQKKLLKESEARLRSTLDNMIEGCQIIGFDWRYLYINDAAERHNQRSKEELMGKKYMDMWPGIESTEVFAVIKRCLEEHVDHIMENEFEFPDGSKGWFELKIQSIPDGVFILSYDITVRKKILNDLIAAKEKAEEINKVKSHFFANMSHELRTPFVGIMGYAEILSEILTDPETKEMAEGILRTSQRMKETLTKILNLSKYEFNGIEVVNKEINVTDIIDTVYNQYAAAAEQKNLEFKVRLNFDPFLIETDESLFLEILNNLVSNAIIYTNKGKVEIKADKLIKGNKSLLIIKIADTGIGIPKDKQEIIWEEFRQASEGFARKYEGTGLGLSIAKKYTHLLGGEIYLESKEGKGSTFTIELPVQSKKIMEIKDKVNINTAHEHSIENNITKKKLLYVEDDKAAAEVIKYFLSNDYDIESADNVETALSKINKSKYDAILMDINLGRGINGEELTQEIKMIQGYESTPVIAVTAYAREEDKREFLSKGMSHYIAKPFSKQELLILLEKVFNPK